MDSILKRTLFFYISAVHVRRGVSVYNWMLRSCYFRPQWLTSISIQLNIGFSPGSLLGVKWFNKLVLYRLHNDTQFHYLVSYTGCLFGLKAFEIV